MSQSVPPAPEPLRVGMIGAGGIAGAHLPAWLGIGAQVSVYAADGGPELTTRFGGGTVVDSLEELITRVDVIDVCTPTPFHRHYIEAAAAAGKHVVSEKPLGRTSADARAAIDACNTAGVQLYPGQVVRFFDEYATMHRAVANGTIGEIAVQRFTRGGSRPKRAWYHDDAQSGGIILDQMIHDLDFARWNAGEVRTAFARIAKNGTGLDAVVNAQVVLTHTNGVISYVGGFWARLGTTFRTTFEIAGTKGILRHDSTQYLPVVFDGGDEDPSTSSGPGETSSGSGGTSSGPGETSSGPGETSSGTGLLPATHGVSPFATELGEFARAFTGGPAPRVSAEDAYAAIVIAEAAITSLRTGQPVAVEPAGVAA